MRWRGLTERQRRSIVRRAHKGTRPDTALLTEAACAWAVWVLEQNQERSAMSLRQRALDWLVIAAEAATGPVGAAVMSGIYSGEPGYEFLSVVRRAASAVHAACCEQACPGRDIAQDHRR